MEAEQNKSIIPAILFADGSRDYSVLSNVAFIGCSVAGIHSYIAGDIISRADNSDYTNVVLLDDEPTVNLTGELVREHGFKEIIISDNEDCHINPLDLDCTSGFEGIYEKKKMMVAFLEAIIYPHNNGFNENQKKIVENAIDEVYKPYMEKAMNIFKKSKKSLVYEIQPTLEDLWNIIRADTSRDAQMIAMALELYAVGNYKKFFGERTTLNLKERGASDRYFLNLTHWYDKLLCAMQIVCMDFVHNYAYVEMQKGRNTLLYNTCPMDYYIEKDTFCNYFTMYENDRKNKYFAVLSRFRNFGLFVCPKNTDNVKAVFDRCNYAVMFGYDKEKVDAEKDMFCINPSKYQSYERRDFRQMPTTLQCEYFLKMHREKE